MEEKMGKKFFCCDAVLDTWSRQIAIFSGYAAEMQPVSWALADKRTYVHWAEKKYDIVVMGMPTNFHYGRRHGHQPHPDDAGRLRPRSSATSASSPTTASS